MLVAVIYTLGIAGLHYAYGASLAWLLLLIFFL